MLFQNLETGAFGLSIDQVRAALPNMSIPDEPAGLDPETGFASYAETTAPVPAWDQEVAEVAPVGGQQQWALTTLTGGALAAATAALLQGRLSDLSALYSTNSQAPLAWNFGATSTKDDDENAGPPAGAQTLQMRVDPSTNTDDPKNWLGVYAGALAAVIGGASTAVIPIKATSNLWIQTTAAQVVQVLATGDGTQTGMLPRQSAILARYGALKAALNAAADGAAINAIDITQGWPA